MELKLDGGKYAAGKYSDLLRVTGDEENAQRIAMKLTARRGGFAPMPDYGSRLYTLTGLRAADRQTAARQYIAEALEGETGTELSAISISEAEGELELRLTFAVGGEEINVETVLEVSA